MRSDARRNVEALVDAAKTVFVRNGVDAPAKEITDLAAVGVGTLYRHFPRRSDLIVAVLQHEIDECVAAANELSGRLAPWEALVAWVDRLSAFVATKRGLAAAMHSGDPAYDGLPERLVHQLEPALAAMLDRAIAEGAVRSDVTAREVITTVSLLSQSVPSQSPDFSHRMTQVFVDGLRLHR
jgi:AcrR family transcriptional regulator